METSLETKVWIVGSPPFALCYQNASKTVPVELQAFRPDPENYLEKTRKYRAVLFFETKNRTLEFLRKVKVFINKNNSFIFYRF